MDQQVTIWAKGRLMRGPAPVTIGGSPEHDLTLPSLSRASECRISIGTDGRLVAEGDVLAWGEEGPWIVRADEDGELMLNVGGYDVLADVREVGKAGPRGHRPLVRMHPLVVALGILASVVGVWAWAIDRIYRMGGTNDYEHLGQLFSSSTSPFGGILVFAAVGLLFGSVLRWIAEPRAYVVADVRSLLSDVRFAIDDVEGRVAAFFTAAVVAVVALAPTHFPPLAVGAVGLMLTLLRSSRSTQRLVGVLRFLTTRILRVRDADVVESVTLVAGCGLLAAAVWSPLAVAGSVVLVAWANRARIFGSVHGAFVVLGAGTLVLVLWLMAAEPVAADDGGATDIGCEQSLWADTCEGAPGVVLAGAPPWILGILALIGGTIMGTPGFFLPADWTIEPQGGGPGPSSGNEPGRPKEDRPPWKQEPPGERPRPEPEPRDQDKRNKQRRKDKQRIKRRQKNKLRNRQRRGFGKGRVRGGGLLGVITGFDIVKDLANTLGGGPEFEPIEVYPTDDPGVFIGADDGAMYWINDDGYLVGPIT